jgi:hypothetical protein
MPRTKRKKIPLYKYNVGTLDHVRLIGSKDGRNAILFEMQRKKPSYIVKSAFPLKKNPEKITFYQEKNNPFGLQIFTYKNQLYCFFLTRHGSLISIEAEKIPEIQKALEKAKNYFENIGII